MKAVEAFEKYKDQYKAIATHEDCKKFLFDLLVTCFGEDYKAIAESRHIKSDEAAISLFHEVNTKCNRTIKLLEEYDGRGKIIRDDAFKIQFGSCFGEGGE